MFMVVLNFVYVSSSIEEFFLSRVSYTRAEYEL